MSSRGDFVVMRDTDDISSSPYTSTPATDDVHEMMLSVSQPGHDDHDEFERDLSHSRVERSLVPTPPTPSTPRHPIVRLWRTNKYCRWSCYGVSFVCLVLFVVFVSLSKPGGLSPDAMLLANSITADHLKQHLIQLQAIADASNGTRHIAFHGFNDSLAYIRNALLTTDSASSVVLDIYEQSFIVPITREIAPAQFSTADHSHVYTLGIEFQPLAYERGGQVTAAPVQHIPEWGCQPDNYVSLLSGPYVAIIRRSNCTFARKVELAAHHGAVGVVIYNSGLDSSSMGLFGGTLGPNNIAPIPVFGVPYDTGLALIAQNKSLAMYAKTEAANVPVRNLIAETKAGDASSVIVVGAHADSVEAAPGLNDDGSGSTAVLELAIQLSILLDGGSLSPVNKVRFIWFAAEEEGLLGSHAYVQALSNGSFPGQSIKDIALNINLDMLGSPNYVYQVYDGTSGNLSGLLSARCVMVQKALEQYMQIKGVPYMLIPFDGRSDYQPFLDAQIPASGVCSGVDVSKSMAQRSKWGGLANTAYDPCYHQSCDSVDNISLPSLTTLTSTVAYALQTLALQTEPGKARIAAAAAAQHTTTITTNGPGKEAGTSSPTPTHQRQAHWVQHPHMAQR